MRAGIRTLEVAAAIVGPDSLAWKTAMTLGDKQSSMPGDTAVHPKCINCGFEAPKGSDWGSTDHPTLGSMTQCPECGSTDVSSRL